MAYKKTLNGPGGIKLVLDHGDEATPAMVYSRDEKGHSTYDCAVGEGILAHDDGIDRELTAAQVEWLDRQIDAVEKAFEVARKDNPEYD